jgi:hypothetical protein
MPKSADMRSTLALQLNTGPQLPTARLLFFASRSGFLYQLGTGGDCWISNHVHADVEAL